jgi:ATP-dependent Clp protease ATP-binding subunit ClpC
VVVLTSNLGADRVGHTVGFRPGGADSEATHYRSAVASFFRPELINRLDHVVPFHALTLDNVAEIARKMLDQALTREGLVRRGVRVTFDQGVPSRLAALGHDPRYGARPLKRALEQHVMAPLSALLSAHTSPAPRQLHVRVAGDSLEVVVLS